MCGYDQDALLLLFEFGQKFAALDMPYDGFSAVSATECVDIGTREIPKNAIAAHPSLGVGPIFMHGVQISHDRTALGSGEKIKKEDDGTEENIVKTGRQNAHYGTHGNR